MPNSESKARLEVRLKGILDHTGSWARVLEDGRIELEYYDYSPAANNTFGNDVAWMYRIEASRKPLLVELLEKQTGAAIHSDQAMLDAFASAFGDVMEIKKWLQDKEIPFDEEFDSWA